MRCFTNVNGRGYRGVKYLCMFSRKRIPRPNYKGIRLIYQLNDNLYQA